MDSLTKPTIWVIISHWSRYKLPQVKNAPSFLSLLGFFFANFVMEKNDAHHSTERKCCVMPFICWISLNFYIPIHAIPWDHSSELAGKMTPNTWNTKKNLPAHIHPPTWVLPAPSTLRSVGAARLPMAPNRFLREQNNGMNDSDLWIFVHLSSSYW